MYSCYFCSINRVFMEIVEIYPPYIYSVKYDGMDENEFDRLFEEWNDSEKIMDFMMENADYLKKDIWKHINEPEAAVKQVHKEAEYLEDLFYDLYQKTETGERPDYDSHFQYLDGKYGSVIEYIPMKSYGLGIPSLLRIYAIKIAANVYVITGGGIKLARTIQDSPGLKDSVIQGIDKVRSFLRSEAIIDANDL